MRPLSFLIIGLVAACGGPAAIPEATRRDSAGVELVMNTGADHALDWRVSSTDTLFDPAADSTLQGEAAALQVVVDAQGRVIFADGRRADRRVLRRATDGSFRQIGHHGGGPGEYEMVGAIGVAPSGELLIGDYVKEGYLRFDSEGHPLSILRWRELGRGFSRSGGYFAGGIAVQLTDMGAADGDDQASAGSGDAKEPRTTQSLYFVTATDTTRVAQLRELSARMARFERCETGFAWPPLFAPALLWAGNAELLAVNPDGGYRIDVWRGGKLTRSIRREFTPRTVTKALAEQQLAPGSTISFGPHSPCFIPASELVEKQGFAATLPAVRRLSLAADGTLWVERWTLKGDPVQRDIFDSTGAYLGTLTADTPWPQAWLPDGRYLSVLANADSLPVVVRYGVGGAVRKE